MILNANSQIKYSSRFLYNKEHEVLLFSYKPNDKNKLVLLINSSHHGKNVTDDVEIKPEIIDFYKKTKIDVDSFDQLIGNSPLTCVYDICM